MLYFFINVLKREGDIDVHSENSWSIVDDSDTSASNGDGSVETVKAGVAVAALEELANAIRGCTSSGSRFSTKANTPTEEESVTNSSDTFTSQSQRRCRG